MIELNKVNETVEYVEIPELEENVQGWEFCREKLQLLKPLGCGEFGQVYKGLAYGLNKFTQNVEVAVKLLKGIKTMQF